MRIECCILLSALSFSGVFSSSALDNEDVAPLFKRLVESVQNIEVSWSYSEVDRIQNRSLKAIDPSSGITENTTIERFVHTSLVDHDVYSFFYGFRDEDDDQVFGYPCFVEGNGYVYSGSIGVVFPEDRVIRAEDCKYCEVVPLSIASVDDMALGGIPQFSLLTVLAAAEKFDVKAIEESIEISAFSNSSLLAMVLLDMETLLVRNISFYDEERVKRIEISASQEVLEGFEIPKRVETTRFGDDGQAYFESVWEVEEVGAILSHVLDDSFRLPLGSTLRVLDEDGSFKQVRFEDLDEFSE